MQLLVVEDHRRPAVHPRACSFDPLDLAAVFATLTRQAGSAGSPRLVQLPRAVQASRRGG